MTSRALVVVEVNEVPLRVIEAVLADQDVPNLRRLIEEGHLIETEIREDLGREPYPSQSWASFGTGVPYADHGVWWYGDPKPADHPFYWQVAARSGVSVGSVGTLHSSPLDTWAVDSDVRFAVPDAFAADAAAIPQRLSRFQALNLRLTSSGSRTARVPLSVADLGTVVRLPGFGVRPSTWGEIARLVAGVARGTTPRERLRVGQFLLLGDIFLRQLDQARPQLATIFTNHVASAMHRYWYASFPDDFEHEHYGPEWVERYCHEIPEAMRLLDRFLGRLLHWCERHGRTVVLASSMGQGPSAELYATDTHSAVVRDAEQFLRSLGLEVPVEVVGAMTPQLTFRCRSSDDAGTAVAVLADPPVLAHRWEVDKRDRTVTLTYKLALDDEQQLMGHDGEIAPGSFGIRVDAIDDHSSGRHIARGVLAVWGSPTWQPPTDPVVDYLDVAPALLELLDVPRLEHHREPAFRL